MIANQLTNLGMQAEPVIAKKAIAPVAKAVNKMLGMGADREEVLRRTGGWAAPDGAVLQEIPDQGARLTPDTFNAVSEERAARGLYGPGKLGDYLDHPELYERVPGARDLALNPQNAVTTVEGPRGAFSTPSPRDIKRGRIDVYLPRIKSMDEALSVLMHEVQHAVSAADGRAYGASPGNWTEPLLNTLRPETVQRLNKMMRAGGIPQAKIDELSRGGLRDYYSFIQDAKKQLEDVHSPRLKDVLERARQRIDRTEGRRGRYLSNLGEGDARAVQKRLEDNSGPFWDSYDMPEEKFWWPGQTN